MKKVKHKMYNFNFSPESYFEDLTFHEKCGSKILGEERRKKAMDKEKDRFYPTELINRKADEALVKSNISVNGPTSMGGEYIPFNPNEIEIARIILSSVTQDVFSMRVLKKNKKLNYKIVSDYSEDQYFTINHQESFSPLTMNQVIENIDTAKMFDLESKKIEPRITHGLVHSFLLWEFDQGARKDEIINFVAVDSVFYPELKNYYYDQINNWVKELNDESQHLKNHLNIYQENL